MPLLLDVAGATLLGAMLVGPLSGPGSVLCLSQEIIFQLYPESKYTTKASHPSYTKASGFLLY